MKKVVKKTRMKLISWVCAFALIVPLFAALQPIDAEAKASSFTQAQAVAWMNQQVGKSLDYDGWYGAQCVDLIMYYYAYLGETVANGNAVDYNTSTAPRCPTGWTRVTSNPQPGDVVVWGTSFNPVYGHIGLVMSVSGSTMTTLEQNVDGTASTGGPGRIKSRTTSGVVCYLRPNFKSSGSTPTIPTYGSIFQNIGAKITSGANTNVRASASTSAAIVTTLANNTSVTISGYGKDSSNVVWYRISSPVSGFIRSDLVTSNTVSISGKLYGGGVSVNIRNAPTTGTIVATRACGTAITVTGIVAGTDGYAWYRISSPNAGFVRADLAIK